VRDPAGYAATPRGRLVAREPDFGETPEAPQVFDTPGVGTIDELAALTGLPPARLAKSVVVVADGGPVLALVRGEHALHEKKLHGSSASLRHHLEGDPRVGATWVTRPVGLPDTTRPRVADGRRSMALRDGANREPPPRGSSWAGLRSRPRSARCSTGRPTPLAPAW
jgi:hypothetical protein